MQPATAQISTDPVAALEARVSALGRTSMEELDERVIATGANINLSQPWRITRVVYPQLPRQWPVEGKTTGEVLAECVLLREGCDRRRASGHWTYSRNFHLTVLQAERALTALIAKGR